MNISTSHLEKMTTGDIPEWGTPEYKLWWESQYDSAESHNIEFVDDTSLELNRIFWELEEETFAYGVEIFGK